MAEILETTITNQKQAKRRGNGPCNIPDVINGNGLADIAIRIIRS